MKKIIVIFIFVIGCFLAGCSVNPSELSDGYAKEFASKIKYIQDERNGLCFAIVAVATRAKGSTESTGIGFSLVPCEKCQHLLVK